MIYCIHALGVAVGPHPWRFPLFCVELVTPVPSPLLLQLVATDHHHSTLGDPGSSSVPSRQYQVYYCTLDPVRREAKRTVPYNNGLSKPPSPSKKRRRCQQEASIAHQSFLSGIPSYLLLDTPLPGTGIGPGICANHRHARTHSLACLASPRLACTIRRAHSHQGFQQQQQLLHPQSTWPSPPTISRHVVSQIRWSPSLT